MAIGGSDNHGGRYRIGPFTRDVFPYSLAFRTVNTHILTAEPLSGSDAHDRDLVFGALREGRCWVGYDLLGSTKGFRFCAHRGGVTVPMGSTVIASQKVTLSASLPLRGRMRLLHDGRPILQATGRSLHCSIASPGVYRLEAYRRSWGRWRGWIFSNPIYVR